MLDLAILGLLEERELHGYEIRRQLREHLGLLANVSYGSLYPALARLEAAGSVEATAPVAPAAAARPKAPPTGSLSGELAVLRARGRHSAPHGRRSRKVFRITEAGRRNFAELLAGGGPDDARTFSLRLAFARHLSPHARIALLERRRAVLAERLTASAGVTVDPELDVYARTVVEHTTEGVARDIRWLDHLIEAERMALAERPALVERPALAEHGRAGGTAAPAAGRSSAPATVPNTHTHVARTATEKETHR
jgi:DNA-binding PadR family transcriptional regulator